MLIRRHCACKILPFCCRKTCCPDNFLSESTWWKCQWFPARFKSSRKIEMNWNKVWFKFHGDLCSVSGPIKEVCSKSANLTSMPFIKKINSFLRSMFWTIESFLRFTPPGNCSFRGDDWTSLYRAPHASLRPYFLYHFCSGLLKWCKKFGSLSDWFVDAVSLFRQFVSVGFSERQPLETFIGLNSSFQDKILNLLIKSCIFICNDFAKKVSKLSEKQTAHLYSTNFLVL